MKLLTRVSISSITIFAIAIFSITILSYVFFKKTNDKTAIGTYRAVSQLAEESLYYLEKSTDERLDLAAQLITARENEFIKMDRTQLEYWARKWNFIYLFILDGETGNFLVSTCEPIGQVGSIYGYCSDYKHTLIEKGEHELTPFIRVKPGEESFKFLMFPSRDRKKIFEIALSTNAIGNTLIQLLRSFPMISSIGLYMSNGENLGTFSRGKEPRSISSFIPVFSGQEKSYETDTDIVFLKKIKTTVDRCCECNLKKGEKPHYIIKVSISKEDLNSFKIKLLLSMIFLGCGVCVLFIPLIRYQLKSSFRDIHRINDGIDRIMRSDNLFERIPSCNIYEYNHLSNNINIMIDWLVEKKDLESYYKESTQIVHDLKTPINTLKELVEKGVKNNSDNIKKILFHVIIRIEDLVLVSQNKITNINKNNNDEGEVNNLYIMIQRAIREKEYLVIGRKDISFELKIREDERQDSFFIKINYFEFSRCLSNVLNNSIQAKKPDEDLKVEVDVYEEKYMYVIIVHDNGIGIDESKIDGIFKRGFTTKQDGSGLGLSGSMEILKKYNGNISIESEKSKWTDVIIKLPKQDPPYWYVDKIVLSKEHTIIILDDDLSVHEEWGCRLKNIGSMYNCHFKILSFTNISSFEMNIKSIMSDTDVLYLVDYCIENNQKNGLDIIEGLGIISKSILVTNLSEQSILRNRCNYLKLKMIPKDIVNNITIEVE